MNENLLLAFTAVTAAAVVLQMLILAGMYGAMRKMMKRTEALQERVLPLVDKLRTLADEATPKLQSVVDNVTKSSELVLAQAGKVDEAVTEIVTKARNQVSRADALATRTMERVDSTAATVQNTVITPVRKLSGLLDGIAAGFTQFAGSRKQRQQTKTSPSEDMFI
jgi:methyl-accepting chemotaxis protein